MAQQTPLPNSILKDTREAKGMTLEIVHEATKIPMDALKALEQGYSVRILTPFYYRGFIKIYAEFLGLDPLAVLKAYNLDQKVSPVIQTSIASAAAPAKSKVIRQVNSVDQSNPVGDAFAGTLKAIFQPKYIMIMVKGIGVLLALFLVIKMAGCTVHYFKNRPKAKAKPVAVKVKDSRQALAVKQEKVKEAAKLEKFKEEPVEQALPVESAADTMAQSEPPVVQAQSAGDEVRLVARATRDSWIQVKADGKTVFAMTMQKGTIESWTASKQIELSGRNINLLELEVNGKHMGQLGSEQRRAKKVVITKEGLSVQK